MSVPTKPNVLDALVQRLGNCLIDLCDEHDTEDNECLFEHFPEHDSLRAILDDAARVIRDAQALLSDIDGMAEGRSGWYGPFGTCEPADYDGSQLIEWPNLQITADALRASLDSFSQHNEE